MSTVAPAARSDVAELSLTADLAAALLPLDEAARADVVRYAQLRAAPVDREALGREDYAASAETEAHRELLRKQWDYTSDGVRENHRRGAEQLYRMGQAHGDARLREAAAAVVAAWDDGAYRNRLTNAIARLHLLFVASGETQPSKAAVDCETSRLRCGRYGACRVRLGACEPRAGRGHRARPRAICAAHSNLVSAPS